MDGLIGLPWEVFMGITNLLPRADLAALLSVSKKARVLVEPALYRSVTINRKPTFTKLARVLAARPHLCDIVRTFSVGTGAPWWSLDFLYSFTLLQEFDFEADNLKHRVHMIKEVAKGTWAGPTLRRCSIKLHYSTTEDIPVAVQERLLCAILSTPSLQEATVSYVQKDSDYPLSQYRDMPVPARPLPSLSEVGFTNLRVLTLHWDGLSLPWLSALLRLPQALESLHLRFPERYTMHDPDVFMPLEVVLRPVASTLRTLTIWPLLERPGDFDPRWKLENTGIRWSPNGLDKLQKLDCLGMPGWSWENQQLSSTSETFRLSPPQSMTTLFMIEVRLDSSSPSQPPAGRWLTLDWGFPVDLGDTILAVFKHAPQLKYLQVNPDISPDVEETLRTSSLVYLWAPFKPLVDRGIKIVVQPPGGDRLELGTRLSKARNKLFI